MTQIEKDKILMQLKEFVSHKPKRIEEAYVNCSKEWSKATITQKLVVELTTYGEVTISRILTDMIPLSDKLAIAIKRMFNEFGIYND